MLSSLGPLLGGIGVGWFMERKHRLKSDANRCHEPVPVVGRVAPRAPFREIGIKPGARGATRPTLSFIAC